MKVLKWLVVGVLCLVVVCVGTLLTLGHRPHAGDTRLEVDIARPPQVVWEWITRPEHAKQWVSWLAEVRQDTHGVEGVGARETWIMEDPNRKERMEIPSEVTAYDPPRGLSVHIVAPGMFVGEAIYTLTPTSTGTHLVQDGHWRYAGALPRLMEPLITPQANAKGQADFLRLKSLIEAH